MKSEDSNGKVGIEVGSKKMLVKNTAEVRDSIIREVEVTHVRNTKGEKTDLFPDSS